jgi:F-box-like
MPSQISVPHEIFSLAHYAPATYPRPSISWFPVSIDGSSKGSFLPARGRAWRQVTRRGRRTCFSSIPQRSLTAGDADYLTNDLLPDNVLLEIFEIYLNEAARTEGWYTLVHVCRRWRNVVFASPRRLDLKLYCTTRTPVKAWLDVWPAFPIVLTGDAHTATTKAFLNVWPAALANSLARGADVTSLVGSADNIMAALEQRDRMCHIDLQHIPKSLLEQIAAAMEETFPALLELSLESIHEMPPVLPNMFLGGSAPGLRALRLTGIPFPALGKLLLSTTHLVYLSIWDVPHSGYISPDAMVTALAALTNLGEFYLGFRSPLSRPDRENQRPLSLTRVVLPALSRLEFKGVSEYFEKLVAQIDAPLLDKVETTFFHQLIFDTPQISQLFSRTDELKAPYRADVSFHPAFMRLCLYARGQAIDRGVAGVVVECRVFDWQLSSLAQLCSSSLFSLSTLERLVVSDGPARRLGPLPRQERRDVETTQWLEFLRPFRFVRDMYLGSELAIEIAFVLANLDGAGTTEVLPGLQNLFLMIRSLPPGMLLPSISQFLKVRRRCGRPVAVHEWQI